MDVSREAVAAYWEKPETVSIIDKNLHQLEIDTALRHLLPTDSLADIGCGNGEATVQYAKKVRRCVGFEQSEHLRKKAMEAVEKSGLNNLSIEHGDIMQMTDIDGTYDAVVSQRLLINLLSWEEQMQALENIHRMLKVGGHYVMIENTDDAFGALNQMRDDVNLSPIPQHWHNRFFDYDTMMNFMTGKFRLLKHYDFGLYYFLTRIYTQMFASFEGFGAQAVKDSIFEHSDRAAREVFEKFHDRIRIDGCRALGPIQVFVFRREADLS